MCHSINSKLKKLDEVDALNWWKSNQFRFIIIADLAKKYLGVKHRLLCLKKCSASLDTSSLKSEENWVCERFRIWLF